MSAYKTLQKLFKKKSQLDYINRIMLWDEAVMMMPPGAGGKRAQALTTLSSLIQKLLMKEKNKSLIAAAKEENLGEWDKANLALMEKNYLRAAAIPAALEKKLTESGIICQQQWRVYRDKNDWKNFYPYLEKNFLLTKEVAERYGQALQLSPYDALLDIYVSGFTQHDIDKIFSQLKNELPTLMQKIMHKQNQESLIPLSGFFAVEKQKQLGEYAMQFLQFDFQHGRLDTSHHPFCDGIPADIRVTTRYRTDELLSALMGICHETGHALYEQGLPKKWSDQPVGRMANIALHESQSLLVEMQVCGSLPFYEFILPKIQECFGKQTALSAENLYAHVTRVKPDYIRVDADEVTYPLHVILRYELEKKLFNNEIKLAELPMYWNEYMMKYLSVNTLGNDKNGVMQDVHWPSGAYGYFPAYTVGRLIAAQLYASFAKISPQFAMQIKAGNFSPLKEWLNKNVHALGSLLSPNELLQRVTGETLNENYFLDHLKERYL